jgi:hypothetical protein
MEGVGERKLDASGKSSVSRGNLCLWTLFKLVHLLILRAESTRVLPWELPCPQLTPLVTTPQRNMLPLQQPQPALQLFSSPMASKRRAAVCLVPDLHVVPESDHHLLCKVVALGPPLHVSGLVLGIVQRLFANELSLLSPVKNNGKTL